VGDFRAVKIGSQVQKQGGNVASHILTPDGRVIHSVTGPVDADTLLNETQWALDMYAAAREQPLSQQRQFVAWSHQQAAVFSQGQDRQVHELLMSNPLPPLGEVFDELFEDILGQRVSTAGPRLAQASVRLRLAQETGRPLLLILHEGQQEQQRAWYGELTLQLMSQFVVIVLPLRDAPALSQLTGRPPYETPGAAQPMFIITRSDGDQLDAVSGWNDAYLAQALASAWVDALERKQPSTRDLSRAARLLQKHYPALAERLKRKRDEG
jgi:hypothetical protein